MKKRRKKLRWDNIIKDLSVLALIATITAILIASCQQTKAAATTEEESTKETAVTGLDLYKCIKDIPLDFEFQAYINDVCKTYEIAPEIVFAMIERESGYNAKEIGDNGDSYGLMQVQPQWHEDRMEELDCTDLLDPYENVMVGVDYLAELLGYYDGNMAKALTAYNAGTSGAFDDYFRHGIDASEYAEEVIENSKIIEEGMVLVCYRTDDPAKDAERNDARKEEELKKMPRCSHCNEYIQDDYLFDIEGELYCEEHARELFRKDTTNYIKGEM